MTGWTSFAGLFAALVLLAPPVPERPVTVDGLVRLIESVDVPARRDGRLEKFAVKEGAYIRRGDVLGRLNDSEALLTLKRTELEHQLADEKANSEIAVNAARLTQEVSRSEFERAKQARQSVPSSVSVTEFDRLRLEAEKATSELARLIEERRFAAITAQTKAVELELSRLALEERQVIAPLDGIVVQFHKREGEFVHLGDKVIRVVRIDRLRVEAYVNLSSGLSLLENARAVLEVEFPDAPLQEFTGEVVFVNPEADPVNSQIRIWAEIENRGRLLRPGQRGRLKIFPKQPASDAQQLILKPADDSKPQ